MLKHSQRNIQNQIDSLTQQTTAARWYNTQLATGLPSGRPNSVVRTIATTSGLPLEPEMIAEQAAYVRTILCAKNILPTTRASLSSQLFNVSHPPENLEIHPPKLPNLKFPLSNKPRYQQSQYRVHSLQPPTLFLQDTNGNLIPKPLPGHTSRYPLILLVIILGMIGTNVPILCLDSTYHAYLLLWNRHDPPR